VEVGKANRSALMVRKMRKIYFTIPSFFGFRSSRLFMDVWMLQKVLVLGNLQKVFNFSVYIMSKGCLEQ
jgi:hypothetical protein